MLPPNFFVCFFVFYCACMNLILQNAFCSYYPNRRWWLWELKKASRYVFFELNGSFCSVLLKSAHYIVHGIYVEIRYEWCKNGAWVLTEDFAFITSFKRKVMKQEIVTNNKKQLNTQQSPLSFKFSTSVEKYAVLSILC